MENLEKVELVREKCNVSYEKAREALEACDYDVLDAIVMLEQAHETVRTKARATPVAPEEVTYELPAAQGAGFEPAADGTSKASASTGFGTRCKGLWNAGMETMFVAERKGEAVFEMPVTFVIIGLVFWGASLWLLIAGLFLGFRYRIESSDRVAGRVNHAMDKVADAADNIRQSVA